MKLYPYSRIRTENLKSLLIVSRVIAVIGYILLIISVCIGLYTLFASSGGPVDIGSGVKIIEPGISPSVILISIWGIVSSLLVLAFSGLCAAVVSCEYKFTRVTE